jgi:hypothetical protein
VHTVSHGSEIDDSGYTSEVLKDDTGWAEWDLSLNLGALSPVENGLNIRLLDCVIVTVTYGRLKKNANGIRQFLNTGILQGW